MLQAVLSKYGVENFIGSHFQTYFYQELIFKKIFYIGYFIFFVSNRSRRPSSHSGRPCFNTFANTLVVYHLQKDSGKSGRKVNGTWLFWSIQRKISRSNGTSVKVVLLFRTGYSKQNFVVNFFKVIFDTSFRPSRSFFGKWNRPFPSSQKFRFQNEAKCETFVVKMSFICIIIKDHFHINGFALIASLCKWDFLELGNDILIRTNGKRDSGAKFSSPEFNLRTLVA